MVLTRQTLPQDLMDSPPAYPAHNTLPTQNITDMAYMDSGSMKTLLRSFRFCMYSY